MIHIETRKGHIETQSTQTRKHLGTNAAGEGRSGRYVDNQKGKNNALATAVGGVAERIEKQRDYRTHTETEKR